MLYFKNFANYEEFKNVFPIVKHGNGSTSRKNKILLECLKNRKFFHWWVNDLQTKRCTKKLGFCGGPNDILEAQTMDELKAAIKKLLSTVWATDPLAYDTKDQLTLMSGSWIMFSNAMEIDSYHGLCAEEVDTKAVRYYNRKLEKVYKMKAGKFISRCIEESVVTRNLPEQAKRWISEEFAREWQAWAEERVGDGSTLALYCGSSREDFREIYNDRRYLGDFHSCMAGENQCDFYVDAVDATAAWLENCDGDIVARCVIFNDVTDEDGKTWRLAERQYSTDCEDVLKQVLVSRLIAEGLIDGYKRIGADCHDSRNFLSNDGTSLRDKRFSIHCNLEDGDTMSYQDSFKFYDRHIHVAYNHQGARYTDELDDTVSTFESDHSDEEWSDYEGEWIPCDDASYDPYNDDWARDCNIVSAIYRGDIINLIDGRTDDFVWSDYEDAYIYDDEAVYVDSISDYVHVDNAVKDINGNWQKENDCWYSDALGKYILDEDAVHCKRYGDYYYKENAVWSDILDDWCLDETERLEDEAKFRKEHALMCIA